MNNFLCICDIATVVFNITSENCGGTLLLDKFIDIFSDKISLPQYLEMFILYLLF